MKKKKKSFTLIEVLIAIVLVTGASVFLLSFESSLMVKTKQSFQRLEQERLVQQASVMLFEELFTHHISWKTISEQQSYEIRLQNSDWVAKYDFAHIKKPQTIDPDYLYVSATISLKKGLFEMLGVAKMPLFLKKEGGNDAVVVPP
ncbi:MAG: type II secretion system protein [Verrucomicrobia bacterium]|nr:type II secretion system protein [Verrucomicrobiota bacterium]